jgi:hypothetical protein
MFIVYTLENNRLTDWRRYRTLKLALANGRRLIKAGKPCYIGK